MPDSKRYIHSCRSVMNTMHETGISPAGSWYFLPGCWLSLVCGCWMPELSHTFPTTREPEEVLFLGKGNLKPASSPEHHICREDVDVMEIPFFFFLNLSSFICFWACCGHSYSWSLWFHFLCLWCNFPMHSWLFADEKFPPISLSLSLFFFIGNVSQKFITFEILQILK